MRIVFSRKGFDSGSGGGPSPIVAGANGHAPVSLPIPDTKGISRTTYGDLGLGDLAHAASRGRYGPKSLCHNDPMFLPDGRVVLSQCGAAQGHLAKQGVGEGDVFLFFGLFEGLGDRSGQGRHHRIFGYLRVDEMVDLPACDESTRDRFCALNHPHALGLHASNDTLYIGKGGVASRADDALRLTVPDGPLSLWAIPDWLRETGMTYHPPGRRWAEPGRLVAASRGQEFVTDIGDRKEPRVWLASILSHF